MAFTSDGQENLTLSIPITKATEAEDGTVYVEGLCTDDGLDLDDQVISRDFAVKGLTAWFESWSNVRAMHSSNLPPAGKAVKMEVRPEGVWIKTHVVEPTAIKLVKEGVYQAYSVGISKPRIIRDPEGIAKNGRVVDGIFSEVSLVDFPANPRAKFQLAKRAKSGEIEIVEKAVEVELTKAVPTPADVFGSKGADGIEVLRAAAEAAEAADVEKRDIPEKERDAIPSEDFAGPDESFPIAKPEDVAAAAHLVGKADDPEAVKAKIIAIAKRKGPEFVAQLPESWTKEEKSADADTTPVEPELEKAGARDCPDCGKSYHADSDAKYCANCGTKLPAAKAEKSAEAEVVAPEAPAEPAAPEEPTVEKSEAPELTREQAEASFAALVAQYPDLAPVAPAVEKSAEAEPVAPAEPAPAEPEAAPAEPAEKSEEPDLVKSFDALRSELVKFAPASEVEALRADLTAERESREALEKRLAEIEKSPDPRDRAWRGAALEALRPNAGEATAGRGGAEASEVLKSIILKARKDVTGPAAEQLKKTVGPERAAALIFGEGE